VYLAESPAGALVEVLAHTASGDAPPAYTLLKIVGPDIAIAKIARVELPANWTRNQALTQSIGSNWLESGRSALLQVPSVLVPETWNYLLNPIHAEAARCAIERSYEYPFDLRLKQ
jgi:RES domain-containing protein